jgi:hypothetical protein
MTPGRVGKASLDVPLVPQERIEQAILVIRGRKVIIDADLANLYGVTTMALNQAIKRNIGRFPDDFVFRLTPREKQKLITDCDHLARLKYSPVMPRAFTEHGALMAATVLNSPRAEAMSLLIIRTFVKLRRLLAGNATLSRRLNELEKRYDEQFQVVFKAIRQLLASPEERPKPPIGFDTEKSGHEE